MYINLLLYLSYPLHYTMFKTLVAVAALLLVSACVEPICHEPYIPVGGRCCLDEDGDLICDSDKPPTTTSSTSTTTTSTSSTTTSTTTSSTTTSTTTTSTSTTLSEFQKIFVRKSGRVTTSTTTSTTLATCYDSDGGKRYNIKSVNVTGYHVYDKTLLSGASEYCRDGRTVVEYYCESGQLKSIHQECGNRCVDGRCCLTETSACLRDSDCCSGTCRTIGLMKACL